jgi:Asp-tRNA(Asn)/Glu-tRNA(Gln) amidotransferase C subunit
MSLTQEQIKKLAKNLCKLWDASEKLWWNINGILEYIDLLSEIDTTWVIPTISVIEKDLDFELGYNILRKDIIKEKEISREELLKCSNWKIIQKQIAIQNIM